MTQVVSSTAPKLTAKLRYQNFVLLRILAALLIIVFHGFPISHPLNPYGYTGLVLFLLISITLVGCGRRQETFLTYGARRWRKILQPWLFWTGIYSLVALGLGPDILPLDGFSAGKLLAYGVGGSAVHLWYLPFVFVASLLVWGCCWLTPMRGIQTGLATVQAHQIWIFCLTLVGTFAIALSINGVFYYPFGWPWEQWFTSLPAVFIGLAIATCLKLPPRLGRLWMTALCIAVFLACCWLWGQESRELSYRYIVAYGLGVPLFCASFYFKDQDWPQWVEQLSSVTFGVYLIHYAVLWVAYAIVPGVFGFPGIVFLTVVGSSGLAWIMPKLPIFRRFV